MKQKIIDYAERLREQRIPLSVVQQTREIMRQVPELEEKLTNPEVALEQKHGVIEMIFPMQIRDFLKILCDNDDADLLKEIAAAYEEQTEKGNGSVKAYLRCAVLPTDQQLEGIRRFLMHKTGEPQIEIKLSEDKSIGSGFILSYGNQEYDWSEKGRLEQLKAHLQGMESAGRQGIISILKGEIGEFSLAAREKEVGTVSWVGDGIVNVDGIDHAMYGEVVIFDNGVKAMVQEIRTDTIGCILFGKDRGIREGSRVVRTGKRAGIPVGDAFIGRVVDALGAPIDGGGEIRTSEYRPVEQDAPGIVERKSVSVPLETGILSVDSMFPIGRGQRELIIGDRQTGKTSIAMDTILNQKGKKVICIYVGIGQKASTIARLVGTLKKHGAMDYTVVMSATASDPSSLQYIAPYSGTALAEYFMHQGKDVLIVYDDLSKHAVAYRALSLLLERSPGREAYPGDVFYLHSRLLERSSRLSDELGGGSITALPIIETQAGDVSAYIPTNVISITDGQIFLESDLFFAGIRPAVNVGLSVSRVGGAAQTKAMKKAAGSIRIDLAQYREMEVFTQFSSDLDELTKEQLKYGKGLMELLKQPLGRPLSLAEQVVTLCAATEKVLLEVAPEQMKETQMAMLEYFSQSHPEIMEEIEQTKDLSDDLRKRIVRAAQEFRKENRVVK